MITTFSDFEEYLNETLYNSDIYIGPPITPRKESDIDVRGGISKVGIGGEFVGKGDVTALPERPHFISKIKDVIRRKNDKKRNRIKKAIMSEFDEYISNRIKINKIQ